MAPPPSSPSRGGGGCSREGARVAVIVLGDVGRSPRMQYHARSLASKGLGVSLVGYGGERCIGEVAGDPLISMEVLREPLAGSFGRALKSRAYLAFAALKLAHLTLELLWILLVRIPRPEVMMVQNPPSLPSLLCVKLACFVRGSRFVIDWHNLGHSMVPLPQDHPVRTLLCSYEAALGRQADASFCVSRAFSSHLLEAFRVEAQVLYDRPPSIFEARSTRSSSLGGSGEGSAEEHKLWEKLRSELHDVYEKHVKFTGGGTTGISGSYNPFTELISNGRIRKRKDRPALLVSSTSWTPDEDFGIFLQALALLDSHLLAQENKATNRALPPHVVVVVTGKGPLRAHYLSQVRQLALERISIVSLWLSPADYPLLLSSADLGVSLHTSSSGLDLPMKILDMFGSGLPVCAADYNCISELVIDGQNGRIFRTAQELCDLLVELLADFASGGRKLSVMTAHAKDISRWEETWDSAAWPTISLLVNQNRDRYAASAWHGKAALLMALSLVMAAAAAKLGWSGQY